MESGEFWNFSLKVYAKPGVEAACLDLQNIYALDVNLLLFCVWLDSRQLDQSVLNDAISLSREWSGGVVRKIRQARERLKLPLPEKLEQAAADTLRSSLKQVELCAEQIHQNGLQALLVSQTHSSQTLDMKVKGGVTNVYKLLDALSMSVNHSLIRNMSVVIAAAFDSSENQVMEVFNCYTGDDCDN